MNWQVDALIGELDMNRIEKDLNHLYVNTYIMAGSFIDPGSLHQSAVSDSSKTVGALVLNLNPGEKIKIEKTSHMLGENIVQSTSVSKLYVKAYVDSIEVGSWLCSGGTEQAPIYHYSDDFVDEILYENGLVQTNVLVKLILAFQFGAYYHTSNSWNIRLGVRV